MMDELTVNIRSVLGRDFVLLSGHSYAQFPALVGEQGVGLYFAYLRRMLAFSALATVLTLPHLFISFFGKSLSRAEMDALRLLTFAAGNHR